MSSSQAGNFLLSLLLGYLLGSLPTGPWLGRLAGIDVQRQGSGNSGATNVARSVGAMAGIATLLGDILKGWVAVRLSFAWQADVGLACVTGLAALLGHAYSFLLGFSGGKGVATAFGAFLALAPGVATASVATFAAVAGATRIASLASLTAACSLPVASYFLGAPASVTASAVATALFVVARHRDNLRRLADGTEPRFRAKRATPRRRGT